MRATAEKFKTPRRKGTVIADLKKIGLIITLGFFVCLGGQLQAFSEELPAEKTQSPQAPVEKDTTGRKQKPIESENSNEHETVGEDTPDVFIPTEDISEDLAVAFPVDI